MSKVNFSRASFKYPLCYICKKPVDQFLMERPKEGKIVLIARCHGSQTEKELDEDDLYKMETDWAFSTAQHILSQGQIRHKEKSYNPRIPRVWKLQK